MESVSRMIDLKESNPDQHHSHAEECTVAICSVCDQLPFCFAERREIVECDPHRFAFQRTLPATNNTAANYNHWAKCQVGSGRLSVVIGFESGTAIFVADQVLIVRRQQVSKSRRAFYR